MPRLQSIPGPLAKSQLQELVAPAAAELSGLGGGVLRGLLPVALGSPKLDCCPRFEKKVDWMYHVGIGLIV